LHTNWKTLIFQLLTFISTEFLENSFVTNWPTQLNLQSFSLLSSRFVYFPFTICVFTHKKSDSFSGHSCMHLLYLLPTCSNDTKFKFTSDFLEKLNYTVTRIVPVHLKVFLGKLLCGFEVYSVKKKPLKFIHDIDQIVPSVYLNFARCSAKLHSNVNQAACVA